MSGKILLIEDDVFVADLYKKVLDKVGYEVVIAEDGEKALDIVKKDSYSLILLDIMLPKLTGLEVLAALKKEGSGTEHIPVYALSNLGEENIVKEAYKLGVSGYLMKSNYLPKQLADEVSRVLEEETPSTE